jgi:hypothetical protein
VQAYLFTAKRIPDNSMPERACRRTTTFLRRNFSEKLLQAIARNFPPQREFKPKVDDFSANHGGFFRCPLQIVPLATADFLPAMAEFSASQSEFFGIKN